MEPIRWGTLAAQLNTLRLALAEPLLRQATDNGAREAA